MSKYTRTITQTISGEDRGCSLTVDVYDVLRAFAVTDPAIQHAVKKLLCTGIRGHKDSRQDLEEAVQSIHRALDVIRAEEAIAKPIDAKFKVAPDAPSQPQECPFKVGDIIQHCDYLQDMRWRVVEITTRGAHVKGDDYASVYMFVPNDHYVNYHRYPKRTGQQITDCPFRIGDVIQSRDDELKMKWKITHIKDGKLLVTSHDPYRTPSCIELQFWRNYRVVPSFAIDSPPPTC
jgi:hypothetical protein